MDCNNYVAYVLLGRDCLKALFGKRFPPPLNWVKSGFSRKSRNGFKVGEKWVLTHFLHPKPSFGPTLAHWQNTHLKPTLSGNKLFSNRRPWGSPDPTIMLLVVDRWWSQRQTGILLQKSKIRLGYRYPGSTVERPPEQWELWWKQFWPPPPLILAKIWSQNMP